MIHPSLHRLRSLPAAIVVLVAAAASTAAAQSRAPLDEDPWPQPGVDVGLPWFDGPVPSGRSSISVGVAVAQLDQAHQVAGTLLVTLPTDRWLTAPRNAKSLPAERATRSPPKGNLSSGGSPAGAQPRGGSDSSAPLPAPCIEADEAAGRGPSPQQRGSPSTKRQPLPRIRSRDVRAAVRAAQRTAGLGSRFQRLDDLASRARWSAALPRLRLRIMRRIDESAALSPTSYDAERRTASGGASLWLEARSTWQLDRALFTDDEIRLEGLRYRSHAARRQAAREVLEALLAWQHAVAELVDLDSSASFEECRLARLRVEQAAVALDLMTGGWFDRWARHDRTRRPTVDCSHRWSAGVDH